MRSACLAIGLLALLLSGCARPPRHSLDNARQAVANAYAVGAAEIAVTEYRAARAALTRAEVLIEQGEYAAAREILSYAAAQARLASEHAVAAKLELARQDRIGPAEEEQKPQARPLPGSADASPPKPTAPQPRKVEKPDRYEVASEESLRDIARREEIYADASLWPVLYKANRDQVKDPRRVYPGQILTIPRDLSAADLAAAREEAAQSAIFD